MIATVSPGTTLISRLLDNHKYESGILTTIYGPGASGKTTCCYLASIDCARKNFKVIFLDTENGFNIERFKQLSGHEYNRILENILLIKINSFRKQAEIFNKLIEIVQNKKIRLIVVDTIGSFYRLELKNNPYKINKALDKQLRILTYVSREYKKVVLITNQVYSNINEKHKIKLVGGEMIQNWSKCLIELQKTFYHERYAQLKKHVSENRDLSHILNKKIKFVIKDNGIFPV